MSSESYFGIRGDLRHDGEVCEACLRFLASTAELRCVRTRGRMDLLAICECGEATVIPWSSERWGA